MATVTSAQDGDWNTASTWTGGAVPTADDTVVVGHAVTIAANASAKDIYISAGSLTSSLSWDMTTKVTLTCDSILMYRMFEDARQVRLDGITLIVAKPSVTCIKSSDSFPSTYGPVSNANRTIIIDDPGMLGYSAQMQDIKPEGCARAYARKISNGVRYINVVVHIRNGFEHYVGQLYRMAENPFQVLAVTNSAVLKGYIEAITPVDSVGKEYRTFRVSIAEGP